MATNRLALEAEEVRGSPEAAGSHQQRQQHQGQPYTSVVDDLIHLMASFTLPQQETRLTVNNECEGFYLCISPAAGCEFRRSRGLGIFFLRRRHLILIVNDFHV